MKILIRYVLVIAVSTCLFLSLRAQNKLAGAALINDLQNKISKQPDDTNKVNLLNDLSFEYNTVSPYDGIKYGKQSIELAEKLHWKRGIARANSCLGANYYSISDYANAYKFWLASLNINEELNYVPGISRHLHNIGNIFFSQGNYDKALEYYNKALAVSEKAGNKKFATNSYTAIGNVYAKQNEPQKALEYHFKALAIDKELGLTNDVAADQINIGAIYNDQGDSKKALDILFQALQIKKESGEKNGQAKAYSMIGKIYLDIAKAGAKDKNSSLLHAEAYLDTAIKTDRKIGYLDNLQKSYEYYSETLELLNKYKEALSSYRQYFVIKDSIFSHAKQQEIFNLEKKAEIEARDRETEKTIEAKEQKEYLEAAGVGTFILVLLTAVILLSHKRINPRFIDVLGTASVLILFEFIELLLHGRIEELTHHDLILTLLCLLALAAIIIPLHHKMEHWMKKRISNEHDSH